MPPPTCRRILEIAIESAADAEAAARAGADRFELCAALEIGGITPSMGGFETVRDATDRPVLPMLRPRGGDFCYDEHEFAALRADAARFLSAGADGVVCGCLRSDGTIDAARTREVVAAAAPCPVVFHRAFDLTPDPLAALECLIDLGVRRVLTSGGCVSAVEPYAVDLLRRLVSAAAGRIEILAGSGIRPGNVAKLLAETGCDQIHSSCRVPQVDPSPLACRAAAMGFGVESEGGLRRSRLDPSAVAQLRTALDQP
ncbi:MAG: hypothetical protein AMXMBFR47_27850 [Planctomycetota bacterium]